MKDHDGLGQQLGHVLVLEDIPIIAMDIEEMLIEFGAASVTLCSSCQQALDVMASRMPQFAVLDIHLGEETSIAVARRLMEAGVPFVFASGSSLSEALPDDLKHAPCLSKPFTPIALAEAVRARLSQDRPG